jgi:hypothetical protein
VAADKLTQAVALASFMMDGLAVNGDRLPADMPAFELCPAHACADPLDDQVALEFSDRADDYDYGPAQQAGCVDLLTEADELDVEPVQLVQHLQEVLYRTGDSIGSPDQDNIELASAGIPVDDAVTEMSATFVARAVEPMSAVASPFQTRDFRPLP